MLVTTHSKPHYVSKQMSVSYILHEGQELRSDFAGWLAQCFFQTEFEIEIVFQWKQSFLVCHAVVV